MWARIRLWSINMGLQWRIRLLTVLGLLFIFAFFWWVSQRAIEKSTQQTLDQQLTVAGLVAALLDQHLDAALTLLETAAAHPNLIPDPPIDVHASSLREAQLQLKAYGEYLFWVDPDGTILWTEPPDETLLSKPFPGFSSIQTALAEDGRYVSNLCPASDKSSPYVLLTVPVFGPTGQISSFLIEQVGIEQLGLEEILTRVAPGGTAYIEVVDHGGMVLASSLPTHCYQKGDHSGQFASLISSQQPLVGECHQCHTTEGEERINRVDEVLAFTPLDVVSWGVAVRQPASEVMAPVVHLRRQVLVGGGILLVAALGVMSWFIKHQIAGPMQVLDKASAQLAAGNLAVPIQKSGIDEVAHLTTNLEKMRVKIGATLEDQRRWNEILEELVEARTSELTTLYEQLESKAGVVKQLLGKVLTAQEEERTRLARELHDSIGQSLTAIIMTTAAVEKSLPADFRRGKVKLGKVRNIASQALKDLRNLIFDLRPEALDDLGLALAVRSQAKEHLESIGVQIKLKAVGLEARLPPEVEIVVFRVVQEAITNIARHAQASEACISLIKNDACLNVQVEDNGVGFDPSQLMSNQGQVWGLRGMEERITLLDGKFHIDSKPSTGTLVLVEIPLDQH